MQTSQFAEYLKILQRGLNNATPATVEPARRGGFRSTTLSLFVLRTQLLKLPAQMPKVAVPVALRLLIQSGKDFMLCPVCKTGKLQLIRTMIFHNGTLVDVKQLAIGVHQKIKSSYADEKQ